MNDRGDRARVYEQVLREGTEDDVRFYIDANQLRELWGRTRLAARSPRSMGRLAPPSQPDVLSPLQEQIAKIISGLDEAEGCALASGAALIARGDVRRQTRDLDFFGLTAAAVDRLVPAVDRALRAAGLVVHHVMEGSGFARLVVESADDRTEVDLATGARLFRAERGRLATMLSGEELAVDKVLALFGS